MPWQNNASVLDQAALTNFLFARNAVKFSPYYKF